MNYQSEYQLEQNLLTQLETLGYERVAITDEKDLLSNLKKQLEKHNGHSFSEKEFAKILNHLNKGNVFDRAKTLRDRFSLKRDNGQTIWVQFLNTEHWCRNEYQVTHQISQEGSYKNRYDVTLLINGLPLVQIELKRRGLELKEAFNQINRYQRHSFWSSNGLFQYVQLFVISNGVNTKYYANNRKQSFKQTFFWTDKENNIITDLNKFTDSFLEKCHVSKIICKYIVLHESDKILMVLRPYQYYAVEALVDQVKHGRNNGYVWHTTGSGKTLTSFKAAQILTHLPKVDKVMFVVDRADLDYQTTKEFNHFSPNCVDGTDNTRSLVKQMADDTPLIVTTLQKLNTALSKTHYSEKLEELANKRVVFIFDECHRSQFGDAHKRITGFFKRHQLFGFTGTPIFAQNAMRNEHGKRTTADLFGKCLHKYVITNAIKDGNVLKFSVEYWGKLKKKDGSLIDEQVEGIDTKEFYEDPERINMVTDWIIQNHTKKTHNKDFSAILCVGSVDALITYYETFKAKQKAGEHNLRVATIFTYGTNEDDKDANGMIEEPDFNIQGDAPTNKHTREKLDEFIADYNQMYGTNFSTRDSNAFYGYYKDIAKRIKERERETAQPKDRVDILLVVNMYLTGFDAKKVNTMYVDKNLKYHGLIQAYSRTNRILNEVKSQGNIVCFRPLKKNTDEAIKLFSNENAQEVIIMEPYEHYVEKFQKELEQLLAIAPTVESVDTLPSENEQLAFVKAFRQLIRTRNVLISFSEFTMNDLGITEQEFEDYKSKYLDLYETIKSGDGGEKASIINDVDFELELIQRDEINVAYILALLAELQQKEVKTEAERKDNEKQKQAIIDLLNKDVKLRSKRELIEQFINQQIPKMKKSDDMTEAFKAFWTEERNKALKQLATEEDLKPEQLFKVIDDYLFTSRKPLRDDVLEAMNTKPKLLERESIIERIRTKIASFVKTFEDGMDV